MFSVVWAVSDPRLLSVAALSAGAHSPRVYLIGGISSLSGTSHTTSKPPVPNIKPIENMSSSTFLIFYLACFSALFLSFTIY